MKNKKNYILFIICGLFLSMLSTFDISHAEDIENLGPEITDYFTILDENGNSKIVYFDDIDQDDSKIIASTKEYDLIKNKNGTKEVVSTFETLEEAENAKEEQMSQQPQFFSMSRLGTFDTTTYSIEETLKDITYGVVYLHSQGHDGKSYLTYSNVSNPGYDGYTTGSYAKDAAYIGMVDGKVRAMQSGVMMDFDVEDVEIVEYSSASISHYFIKGGFLYHRYYFGSNLSTTTHKVGYALKYMKEGQKYYSYDGHYFYSDYPTMINDYQSNVRTHSLNPNSPFYNYYQFLPQRSLTSFSSENFEAIVNDKVGDSDSKMRGLGNDFITNQNVFGVNALSVFGVAGNESSWGTSDIARVKNNLFGHGAVDSNPYYSANGYASPADSVKYHAEYFVSKGYLDAEDWRYNGGHLGDKLSGMNVRYASDPYWGEKAASVYYQYPLNTDDYGKYNIGIINGIQKRFKLYQEPNYSSPVVHTLGATDVKIIDGKKVYITSPRTCQLPVILLDSAKDASGNKWYKIQCDTVLNDSRTDLDADNIYNFNRDYVYIPADQVTIVSSLSSQTIVRFLNLNVTDSYAKGLSVGTTVESLKDQIQVLNSNASVVIKNTSGQEVPNGTIGTGTILSITVNDVQSDYTLVVSGEVNGNARIDAADYLMIKDNIMGKIQLDQMKLYAADVNGNGRIDAADYLMIKDYIMGKITAL